MALSIKKLTKAFGEKVILSDFSYDFSDKGIYIISGNSGSGKTTLLRIIAGLDKEYLGEVIGGGFDNVSYAFQEYRLFPMLTALKNLTVAVYDEPNDNDILSASSLLSRLKFTESDMELFPRELSGGMKQRVSFARAVLKNAPILILDEPTKELDSEVCQIIREIIMEESEKRLVLVVTHRAEDVEGLEYTKIRLR